MDHLFIGSLISYADHENAPIKTSGYWGDNECVRIRLPEYGLQYDDVTWYHVHVSTKEFSILKAHAK